MGGAKQADRAESWAEVMQDDTYVLVQDCWAADRVIRELVKNADGRFTETPDIALGRRKLKAELDPARADRGAVLCGRTSGAGRVVGQGGRSRAGGDQATRDRVFQRWCRGNLKLRAAPLMATWAETFGIGLPQWGIKRMKTKWGTCNIEAERIWLNLELVKKPPQCLEYVIVHELAHFFERNHSDRFVALLDQKLPQWRLIRDELNSAPLAHEEWSA